jgi:hypothetical protein
MEQCFGGEQHVLPSQNVHGSIKELLKHVLSILDHFGLPRPRLCSAKNVLIDVILVRQFLHSLVK